MPRLIDPGSGAPITLDQLVAALADARIDPRDADGFGTLGPLLAQLGRNRDFLAELAIAELKTRCAGQGSTNGYGPQVLLLCPPDGPFVLRANFWPAAQDAMVQASGAAAFVYGMAHDHNFPFLTYGYLGPGYWSDYWERDPDRPGSPLQFTGRRRVEPGQLMLYRQSRDVHAQWPPDAFSVTLNILAADPARRWIDQYRFDPATGAIVDRLNTTPAEVLVTIAAQLGGGNGADLIDHLVRRHPHPRMRAVARAARASVDAVPAGCAALDIVAADSAAATRARAASGPGDPVRSDDSMA